jgi:hypothetical protein
MKTETKMQSFNQLQSQRRWVSMMDDEDLVIMRSLFETPHNIDDEYKVKISTNTRDLFDDLMIETQRRMV